MSLEELGKTYGSDKITCHGYHRFFPYHIDGFRDKQGAMIEIGVENGSSVRMWRDYFPSFQIYGIDKHKCFEEDRIHVFQGDQSNTEDLLSSSSKITEPVYFINDDGSHYPTHQISTFNTLFSKVLQPGGVYILEDIETSYWKRGELYGNTFRFGYKHPQSSIEVFKYLIDTINTFYLGSSDRANQEKFLGRWFSPETYNQIAAITFEQNCIVVRKMDERDIAYRTGHYKHKDFSQ